MADFVISLMIQFFEKAGFFFVPIFAIMGFLNTKTVKSDGIKHFFLIFTLVFLALYLLFGTGS